MNGPDDLDYTHLAVLMDKLESDNSTTIGTQFSGKETEQRVTLARAHSLSQSESEVINLGLLQCEDVDPQLSFVSEPVEWGDELTKPHLPQVPEKIREAAPLISKVKPKSGEVNGDLEAPISFDFIVPVFPSQLKSPLGDSGGPVEEKGARSGVSDLNHTSKLIIKKNELR
jgi:hypothetical protein